MNTELLCRLPLEQARCRELIRQFQAMGSIGHFAAALVESALRRADRAIIDGFFVNGSWKVVGLISGVVRWFQSGFLYHYALVMILGVFVLMTYFVWLA